MFYYVTILLISGCDISFLIHVPTIDILKSSFVNTRDAPLKAKYKETPNLAYSVIDPYHSLLRRLTNPLSKAKI